LGIFGYVVPLSCRLAEHCCLPRHHDWIETHLSQATSLSLPGH
jgi:hypothetical protein